MLLSVRHRVQDFDKWKAVFDEHAASRKEHEASRHRVVRDLDDPNRVTIVTEFPNRAAAEGFLGDPSLGEAMQQAGVDGPPEITMWDTVEEVIY